MPLHKNRLKTIATFFTVTVLLLFAYHQYRSYRIDIATTKQQLRLNALRGQLANYVESLNMSARLYVLTGDREWKQRYDRRLSRFHASFSEVRQLLPDKFSGMAELDSAGLYLFQMDASAFELTRFNRQTEAQTLLFGDEYHRQRRNFRTGLEKLEQQIDAETDRFMEFHQSEAFKNAFVLGTVIVLILTAWVAFLQVSRKWQQQIEEANRRRLEEALAAEQVLQKANSQLRLLSSHLQEVREKEKLAISNDIHEELCQQLAAIKMQTDHLSRELAGMQPQSAGTLQEISARLKEAISFLRGLAVNAYPLVLRDLGLVEALEWESKRVAEHFNVHVIFSADVDHLELDQRTATMLYRAFQERLDQLMINRATEVIANLCVEQGQIVLRIYDNVKCRKSNDLFNVIEDVAIEERIRNLGGTVIAERSKEEENVFTITIAYRKMEQERSFLSRSEFSQAQS